MARTMRVFKAQPPGKAAVVSDAPIPTLRPTYMLVKTVAVAQNPTDWKHLTFVDKPVTIGCDFAGVVEQVGSEVTLPWKKGDRVCGFTHGGNVTQTEDGAFGEYLMAKGDIQIRVPDNMSFEEACTLGVGILTCGQGMYQSLQLPWPDKPSKEKFPILIYGGSTATGALAIQFAKLSGLEVITTCSPRNFDFVKSLGADHVYDYSSPTCGADIRKLTGNKMFWAFDTISESTSPQICADALSTSKQPNGMKPQYGAILVAKTPRDDVDHKYTLGYTVIGEAFEKKGMKWEANPEDFEFCKKFMQTAQKLLEEKKLKPHRHEVRPGGLDAIFGGLDDMKNGKVSGVKLVYRISGEQGFVPVQ